MSDDDPTISEFREDVQRRARAAVEDATEGREDDGGAAEGEAIARGQQFINRMVETDNQVMQNPFGSPVVEIIVPKPMRERVEELIHEWDMNPSGHGVMAQPPSFADDRPDIAEGLVAWQFLLEDGEENDIRSCGYDLDTILDELEGEPVLCTKARRVRCSVPV